MKICLSRHGRLRRAPNSIDWDGPWEFGMSLAPETGVAHRKLNAGIRAIELIDKPHQGMLAPMRFQPVPSRPLCQPGHCVDNHQPRVERRELLLQIRRFAFLMRRDTFWPMHYLFI